MQQQAYPVEHKGTLLPGQTISVNKYTVQVERYLSQGSHQSRLAIPMSEHSYSGGFSFVYLVRTATPVYNTTRHVLKRIAVPNEALLTEVKKEVDIMVRSMIDNRTLSLHTMISEDPERASQHRSSHRRRMAQDAQWPVRSFYSHGILSRYLVSCFNSRGLISTNSRRRYHRHDEQASQGTSHRSRDHADLCRRP